MKRLFAVIVVALLGFAAYSQQAVERDLIPYDKIVARNGVKVYLVKGAELKAKVVTTGVTHSEVTTYVDGKTLEVNIKRALFNDEMVEVFVTYDTIRNISVYTQARVSAQDTLVGDKITFDLTSGGEFDGTVKLNTIDVSASKGATVRLKGTTKTIDASISLSGVLAALDLSAESAFVKVSTKGSAKVGASKLIKANVKSGANLTYTGNPEQVDIKTGIGVSVNVQ
ncbi:MAG: DUF2807 domain-containing protein [Bacteroidales bacterium]|nr:DUF2807 domain-containing protein [Bacteroidales bacterium]MBN2747875.1 DUF2807 domain-containing protein [Bacteroidales bacterium]